MNVIPHIIILLVITLFLYLARINISIKSFNNGIEKRQYKILSFTFLIAAYMIFIVVSVFREIAPGKGGTDAFVYQTRFDNAKGNIFESLINQSNEPGYGFIIWFTRMLSEDYRLALFVIYTIMFLLIINFIKYIPLNIYTPISIFLILTFWLTSFNITRTILAVFIVTSVYIMLFNKKYKKAFLFSLVATSIHFAASISVIVVAVVYYINKQKKFKFSKKMPLYLGGLMLIFTLSIELIKKVIASTKYSVYIHSGEIILSYGVLAIILIVFIASIFKYKDLIELNTSNKTIIIILPIFLSIIPLQINFPIIYRMYLFVIPLIYVFIPSIINALKPSRLNLLIVVPLKFFFILYLIYQIYNFFITGIPDIGEIRLVI